MKEETKAMTGQNQAKQEKAEHNLNLKRI